MKKSDILAMPSLSEGLPVVGMQALAAGLAILGSDVGGISNVVQPGHNGFLVPVNDAAAFAQRLTHMLDPKVLMGMKQASRCLAADFNLVSLSRRLETILMESATIG